MTFSAILITLYACILQTNAQVFSPGLCPEVTVQQNFDLPAYLGQWFEYKSYPAVFQQGGECVTATYKDNLNGTVGVKNYLVNATTGTSDVIYGYAKVADVDSGEGKLLVSFPTVERYDSPYWVLSTDYTNYAVVWACTPAGRSNIQFSWVLTRQRIPDEATIAKAEGVINANSLQDKYKITNQQNCASCGRGQ
ncbi:apolipoprotein D-like [Cloeon dipterum]|uniref:apolipoprotein D-like n=1 Tax=Cloeon dipterum TaxID=197152 RepID=UPI0032206F43